jgi:hypothetical protein
MHLDFLQHRHWRFTPIDNRLLAARQPGLAVTLSDINALSSSLPIVLPPIPDQLPQALLTPSETHHPFGEHQPSLWRHYPFQLVEQRNLLDEQNRLCRQMTVQIDEQAAHFEGNQGYPLFDDAGQPSETLRAILEGLRKQQTAIELTLTVLRQLTEAGVLKPALVRHGPNLIECQLIEAEGLSERLNELDEECRGQATLLAEALLRSQQHLQPQDGLYLTDYQVDPSLQSQRRSWILKLLRRS